MEFGASIFFTDYSMAPVELARALEARGFESLWAPEHSHIPVPRKTPFPRGGELPKQYYDVMDPFVMLRRGGGRHDDAEGRHRRVPRRRSAIRSRRRSWSPRSIRSRAGASCSASAAAGTRGDRGPRHRLQDALQADARAGRGDEGDLDRGEARVSRRVRRFPADDDLAQAGAEAAPADHRRRRLSARRTARRRYGDGWVPIAGRAPYGDVNDFLPKFQQMAAEAGPRSGDHARSRCSAWPRTSR